ncbi:hypothetical protein KUTeg_020161, partial [Tegillarca granosa]
MKTTYILNDVETTLAKMMDATFSTATNPNAGLETLTISTSHINTSGMMSDGMSEPSSPESPFDASDLLGSSVSDEVTAQLAAAGTVGMAAAAAIASARKRKRPHAFETNPSIRKRQQTRLLRKLKNTIEEYTTRVGQQAVVLCCTPGNPHIPTIITKSKPGWGKIECQPAWWPDDVPWANVRSDVRTVEEKKRVSWTEVLRTIVRNCYKHHGREDLLNIFGNEENSTGTVLQTINNPDGTVSIIQIETGHHNQVVTLPDGTKATVAVQTLAEVASDHPEVTAVGSQVRPVSVEMNTEAVGHGVATISEDGEIILSSGTIGHGTAELIFSFSEDFVGK